MGSLGGWRRGPDGRPIHVPLDDLCSQVEAAMRDPAVSFVSLSGLAIDPNTVKALFTKLKTQAAQGRRGDLYLDLADNRMAPANREDFHHILQCLESMPWLRVRLGYDISRNYLTESMANFEPSTQQRVEVASPWQEATLSAAVQELKNAVAKMDHRTEAALKALSGSTAKLKENGKMHSNAIEADVAEAIRRWLVNGKIVCIGYNFQIDEDAWCGDVDAVVAGTAPEGCNASGKEVIIICEAKSNVKKKMRLAVRQVSQNVRRWIDMCRIHKEMIDTDLEFWPDDRTDCRLTSDLEKLMVNKYCDYQVVPAIGGSNLPAETGDAICEKIRDPMDGIGNVSYSPCAKAQFCLIVPTDGHAVSAHAV